jgi:hypothetical protein
MQGLVKIGAHEEKLWGSGVCPYPQHAAEIMELELKLDVDNCLPGEYVEPYRSDRIIYVNGLEFRWEHDRGTKRSKREIEKELEKYRDYEGDVLYTCPTEARVRALTSQATSDLQWFALYRDAVVNPHTEIWTNRKGEICALPRREPQPNR